jgi:hypothetical protein
MFCHNCGAEIPENAKFCNYCGATQKVAAPPSEPEPVVEVTPKQQPIQQQSPSQPVDLQAFKKFSTPFLARNTFIVIIACALVGLSVDPLTAAVFAAFALPFGIAWAYGINQVSKNISEMHANGTYDQVMEEFASSSSMLNGKIRYSENYIFGKGTGRVFRYQDIGWIYRFTYRYFLLPLWSTAQVGDQKGNIVQLCRLKRSMIGGGDEIKQLATLIYEKNPQVLAGYEKKTQQEYQRRIRSGSH